MPEPSFLPTASLETLRARSELLSRLRAFFLSRGFWEVQTPVLSRDTVVDAHLDPIAVSDEALQPGRTTHPSPPRQWFLQTSPEFAMKRLLAAGAEAIFQIGPAFRAGECGPLHNPEFTLAEWYRVGDSVEEGIGLLADLTAMALRRGAPEVVSYREIFSHHTRVDPLQACAGELRAVARRHTDLATDFGEDADAWLDALFSECVQPHLGKRCPVIVRDYPAGQAALARLSTDDPRTAERFELFVDGVELANGYGELLEAEELQRRAEANNVRRRARGAAALPTTSRLADAMRAGLPACSGCALGVDRLLLVARGLTTIAEVLTFPHERA